MKGLSIEQYTTEYFVLDEVRKQIWDVIGIHDDLVMLVKKQKLRWYIHI